MDWSPSAEREKCKVQKGVSNTPPTVEENGGKVHKFVCIYIECYQKGVYTLIILGDSGWEGTGWLGDRNRQETFHSVASYVI